MAADTFVKPVVRVGTTTDGLVSPQQRALILDSSSGFTLTSVEGEPIASTDDGATITGYYLISLSNPVVEDITFSAVVDPRVVLKADIGDQTIDFLTFDSAGPTAILGNDDDIAEVDVIAPAGGEINISVGGTDAFVGVGADFIQMGIASTVRFKVDANGIGFFNATPIAKPTVTGSRADPEAALKDLLTKLALLGLITNSTSA